jgi:porin
MIKNSLLVLGAFGAVTSCIAVHAQTTAPAQSTEVEQALKAAPVSPYAGKPLADLADSGVFFRSSFLIEVASNPIGGLKHGTTSMQYLTLGTDADLDKLVGWNGAFLHATVMGLTGTPLNIKYTGAGISPQEANAPFTIFRFTNLTLEQKLSLFHKNDVNIVAGRLGAFPLFAQSSYACTFQSHFFCGSMYGFSQMTGTALTPVSTWGGRVRYNFSPKIYAQFGAFKIDSKFNLVTTHIFDFGRQGITGTNYLFEAGYETTFANDQMPRRARLGLWHDNAPRNDVLLNTQGLPYYLARGTRLTHTNETGAYILADQVVQRDSPTSKRHLALLTSAVYTNANSEPLKYAFRFGAVKTGTFARRDNDTFGIAAGILSLSNKEVDYLTGMRKLAGGTETVKKNQYIVEVSYSYQIVPGATIKPNFQYYANPDPRNAVSSPRTIPNIGVVGLQLNVSLDTLMGLPKP